MLPARRIPSLARQILTGACCLSHASSTASWHSHAGSKTRLKDLDEAQGEGYALPEDAWPKGGGKYQLAVLDTIVRHGTRTPDACDADEWNELARSKLAALQQQLDVDAAGKIEGMCWGANDTERALLEPVCGGKVPSVHAPTHSAVLTEEGWGELHSLGREFSEFLRRAPGCTEPVVFETSSKVRCVASARAFIEGFAGGERGNMEEVLAQQAEYNQLQLLQKNSAASALLSSLLSGAGEKLSLNDGRMRFFDPGSCTDKADNACEFRPASKKSGKKLSKLFFAEILAQSDLVRAVVESLAQQLHVKITPTDAVALWSLALAKYDVDEASRVGDLLFGERRNYAAMELMMDLLHNYKSGYGNLGSTWQAGVAFLQEWQSQLRNRTRSAPFVRFSFGHAETILPILTWLGLFDDKFPSAALLDRGVPLAERLAMFNSLRPALASRRFRTSEICPFAAQLTLAVWSSAGAEHRPDIAKVFLNGKQVWPVGDENPDFVEFLERRLAWLQREGSTGRFFTRKDADTKQTPKGQRSRL